MSIDLDPLASGFNRSKINENFQQIEDELNNNVLRRDGLDTGESNQLEVDIDMNSNGLINVREGVNNSDAINYGQLTQAIAAASSGLISVLDEEQVATAGQTVFTLTEVTYSTDVNNLSIYINGVRQSHSSYTETSTTTVTFSSPLDLGDKVLFVVNEAQTINTTDAQNVTYKGGPSTVADELNIRAEPFDTVDDMVNSPDLVLGQVVSTLGYHSVGDGGGNDYSIVNTGTGVDDGGRFIDLTGSPTLQAKGLFVEGFYNVKQWGATGDGITDDVVFMQNCEAYVSGIGGGKIFVPNGEYKLDSNTVTGLSQFGWMIRGDNITVEFESTAAILKPINSALRKAMVIASEAVSNPPTTIKNIKVLGGQIDGGNGDSGAVTNESSHGIDIRNAENVDISGMYIHSCRGDQILIGYGSTNVNVDSNTLDGNKASSISGVRQGIAVTSGEELNITNNNIKSCLIGVDLEIDDNQISSGYTNLRKINVLNNTIQDMSSEGIDLITPLVSSTVTIEDINIDNNILNDIDESIIDCSIDSSAGIAERINITNNISDGSNTFKGIVLQNVQNAAIRGNIIPDNPAEGLQIITGCKNIAVDCNILSSTGDDCCVVQESVATTRNDGISFGEGNKFESLSGTGLRIQGSWRVTISGGKYTGTVNGIFTQGSTVSGNNTRAIVNITGGEFVCTNASGFGLNMSDNTLRLSCVGAWIQSDAGATYAVNISSSIAGQPWFGLNVYTLGDAGWNSAAALIDDNAGNAKIVDWP